MNSGQAARETFSRGDRLRKRTEFEECYSGGVRMPGRHFLLFLLRRSEASGPPRLGISVSKKVGNAVERNRVRRRLREIVRLSATARFRSGHDYVLVGRRSALSLPFERMTQDFDQALRRLRAPK